MLSTLKLKPHEKRPTYTSTRSYKNYDLLKFDDPAHIPFHMINFFDDYNDKVHAWNCSFLQSNKSYDISKMFYLSLLVLDLLYIVIFN